MGTPDITEHKSRIKRARRLQTSYLKYNLIDIVDRLQTYIDNEEEVIGALIEADRAWWNYVNSLSHNRKGPEIDSTGTCEEIDAGRECCGDTL